MDAILTHENSDFDAIASLGAATKLYPEATAIAPRRVNRNVRDFLTLYGEVFSFKPQEQLTRKRFKSVLLVDTQSLPSARGLARSVQVCIIDHHPPSPRLPAAYKFTGATVGATTTLLVELVREKNLRLDPLQATLLLLGIYEDTGSLTYSGTQPRDLAASAWLLEQGASLDLLAKFLHHPLTSAQRKLYDQLLKNAESYDIAGHTIVVASAKSRAYVEEVSSLTHQLREVFDPAAIFTLVEMDGQVQIVARADHEGVDVAAVLKDLHGGGHAKAAAAFLRGEKLRAVKTRLLKSLRAQVKPSVVVRDIMSFGARVLAPQTTVAEAAEIARRWGHEGFPVVQRKKLVGVLTRRDIDRALHHKLQNNPIKEYMSAPVSVTTDDPIEHLQRVMMEYGLGQVPVTDADEIVGIVTRTDLLKLFSPRPQPMDSFELAAKLERTLPRPLLNRLRQVAETAHALNYSTYLVGGFVRDLLLDQPNLDLDIVVEGDAVALAQRVAEKFGGRVHSHARFGTAKWILDDAARGTVTTYAGMHALDALDLISARTEFYEYPTALPEVERSSIKLDLHRRDFTINTMAIRLDPDRFGQLLDSYGGRQDLERGLIRVLHNLSFIEDPTRILRAVRFEQRFGFQLETRTAELVAGARDLLDKVSGDRVRHELFAMLNEKEPEKHLARLQELQVLDKLHPRLRVDEWTNEKFRALRADAAPATPRALAYLGLLVSRLTQTDASELGVRLKLAKEDAELLRQVVAVRGLESELSAREIANSALFQLLANFQDDALALAARATDSPAAVERIRLFREKLRALQPLLTGDDLQKMGIEPGPHYREILTLLRNLRLDGKMTSRAEEEGWVKAWTTREQVE